MKQRLPVHDFVLFLATSLLVCGLVATPKVAAADTAVNMPCLGRLTRDSSFTCTANDIQIARATNIAITDPCEFPGDLVTFTATFEVVTTAVKRYAVGIDFDTNGDPENDGALFGTCSISTIDRSSPAFLDLDNDACGDIKKPVPGKLYPNIQVTARCVDSDNDGYLNLPYCTTWNQNAGVGCSGPADAVPGSPSKCHCDVGFNVAVPVPPGRIRVTKTPNVPSVTEPGGDVTFTVNITNESQQAGNFVTLDTLTDQQDGSSIEDIIGTPGITTDCVLPQQLDPGEDYTCHFTRFVGGGAGDVIGDTVTASGVDSNGKDVESSGQAEVSILNLGPSATVTKSIQRIEVTYDVTIDNLSSFDDLQLTDLVDNPAGSLTGAPGPAVLWTNCFAPSLVSASGSYSCQFTVSVPLGSAYSNTVTATLDDGDGGVASFSGAVSLMCSQQ